MAVILKKKIFAKWTWVVFLGLLAVFYLWQKLNVFWEQCQHEDENWETGWTSTGIKLWNRVVAFSPWSQDWEKHHHTQEEDHLMPPCNAPVQEILSYIVLISITNDIRQFWAAVSDSAAAFYDSTLSIMKGMFNEGTAKIASIFYNSFDLLWNFAENLLNEVLMILPDGFRTISIIIICLLCLLAFLAVFIICRRRRQLQVRNKHSFSSDDLSNQNSFASFENMTPVKRGVENVRRETIPRFEADSIGRTMLPESSCVEQEVLRHVHRERSRAMWCMVRLVVFLVCLSVAWEFCRLYQNAVAKKAAAVSAGIPLGCGPEPLSWFWSLTLWLSLQVSWSYGLACDRYYEAVLVNPLWEVNPIMAVTSLVTRCILHPLELLVSSVGRAQKLYFREIPVQWQPFLLLVMVALIVVVLFFYHNYSFSVPMLVRIEPKTQDCSWKDDARQCVHQRTRIGDGESVSLSRKGLLASSDSAHVLPALCQGERDFYEKDPESTSHLYAADSDQRLAGNPPLAVSDRGPAVHDKRCRSIKADGGILLKFGQSGKMELEGIHPDFSHSDVEKENCETKNVTRRKRPGRNVSVERSHVIARAALHEMDPTSNKDVTSAMGVTAKQKPVGTKAPKKGRNSSGRQK